MSVDPAPTPKQIAEIKTADGNRTPLIAIGSNRAVHFSDATTFANLKDVIRVLVRLAPADVLDNLDHSFLVAKQNLIKPTVEIPENPDKAAALFYNVAKEMYGVTPDGKSINCNYLDFERVCETVKISLSVLKDALGTVK